MKKILSLILMTAFVFVCYSQEIREPQFAGEGILVKNNNITKLEKNIVKLETNSGMAVMWGAAIKTNIEIKGAKSPVRTTTEEPIVLIVKALNNEYDPTAFINIFKFTTFI